MKQVSATEARINFFKLLDSALKGEVVIIDRNGIPLQLVRRTYLKRLGAKKKKVHYASHIHRGVDDADQWSWDWDSAKGLTFKDNKSL